MLFRSWLVARRRCRRPAAGPTDIDSLHIHKSEGAKHSTSVIIVVLVSLDYWQEEELQGWWGVVDEAIDEKRRN